MVAVAECPEAGPGVSSPAGDTPLLRVLCANDELRDPDLLIPNPRIPKEA